MGIAFVTGGTGFVGRNLIEQLVTAGWQVVALHRQTSNIAALQGLNVQLAEGSITDPQSLMRTMPDKVDAVFHVAGNTNMWSLLNSRQTRVNVDGTRNMVATAIKRRAGRFIHTSSIITYGLHPARITEKTPSTAADTRINYMRTKFLAEGEVLKGVNNGLDAVILNPANIIGPYDKRNWGGLIRQIHHGKLPGLPSGQASFCHVREVVLAHIAAYGKGRTGHNYLLGGADASYLEIAQRVGEMLDCSVPQKIMPVWLMHAAAHIYERVSHFTKKMPIVTPEKVILGNSTFLCSSDKAVKEFGYQPASLDEMLQDCIRWLRSEKLI
jgi:nucleoside-diphosphate-sugar epimerase